MHRRLMRRLGRRFGAAALAVVLLVTSGASAAGSLCVAVGMAGMGPGETCCPVRGESEQRPDTVKGRCCCSASLWEARRTPSEEASRGESGLAARVVVGTLPIAAPGAWAPRERALGEVREARARTPGPPLLQVKQSLLI